MNKRHILIAAGLTTMGSLAGFGLKTVLAEGIPSPTPLYYSGTLTEGGSLVNAPRHLTINLWTKAMPQTGEVALCSTDVPSTPVINGRFRINLDSTCTSKINANSDVYAEVVVGGNTSVGRSKIGAVPFAVEADHAVSATNATHAGTADSATSAAGALQTNIQTIASNVSALQASAKALALRGTGGGLFGAAIDSTTQFYVEAGTAVAASDTSGNFTINFPSPFPNGVLTIVLTNGDLTSGNAMQVDNSSVSLSSFRLRTSPSVFQRVNFIAIGF